MAGHFKRSEDLFKSDGEEGETVRYACRASCVGWEVRLAAARERCAANDGTVAWGMAKRHRPRPSRVLAPCVKRRYVAIFLKIISLRR